MPENSIFERHYFTGGLHSQAREHLRDSYEGALGDYIKDVVTKLGMEYTYDEANADMEITCVFTTGIGMPRTIHNYSIKWTYLDKVNLRVIDTANKNLLAEAEWTRAWNEDDNPDIGGKLLRMLLETVGNR